MKNPFSQKTLEKITNAKPRLTYVLYLATFLPYFGIVYYSMTGIDFGLFSRSETYYGIDAVVLCAYLFLHIGVFPAVILYDILFLLWKRKAFTLWQKRISRSLLIGVLLSLTLSCAFWGAQKQLREKQAALLAEQTYARDSKVISRYLAKSFGEELSGAMELVKPEVSSTQYRVRTPLLGDNAYDTFTLWLDEDTGEVIGDDFCKIYSERNNLETLLGQKLARELNAPAQTELYVAIRDFDRRTLLLEDTDALLESCDYALTKVYFYTGRYEQEKTLHAIRDFYTSYGQRLLPHAQRSAATDAPAIDFYVLQNDTLYASIYCVSDDADAKTLQLHFGGYSGENGRTIPAETLTLCID